MVGTPQQHQRGKKKERNVAGGWEMARLDPDTFLCVCVCVCLVAGSNVNVRRKKLHLFPILAGLFFFFERYLVCVDLRRNCTDGCDRCTHATNENCNLAGVTGRTHGKKDPGMAYYGSYSTSGTSATVQILGEVGEKRSPRRDTT